MVFVTIVTLDTNLLINADSVQAVVHDVDPAVLGGQHEEGHESSAEIIEVVLLVDPAVVLVLQTLGLVGDVERHHVWPITVEEESFEQLQGFQLMEGK